MSTPIVSILIVSYRNPDLTRRCLQSVEREVTGKPYEVLVLDNASGDGSAEMIRAEFPWLHLVVSEVNLGFAAANNVLARDAQGQFVLLLNPDTLVHPGAFEALLDLAVRFPDAGIYGGRTLRPSGDLDPRSCWGFQTIWSLTCFATGLSKARKGSRIFDPESLGSWQRDKVRRVDVVTGCLLLMRTQLWRELGGFDATFWMYGEDQDLAIRATRAGYRAMITPDAVVTHVMGASSTSADKVVMLLRARVRLMRKHWGPKRTQVGTFLLTVGCGLRAVAGDSNVGWRDAWRRRHEWKA